MTTRFILFAIAAFALTFAHGETQMFEPIVVRKIGLVSANSNSAPTPTRIQSSGTEENFQTIVPAVGAPRMHSQPQPQQSPAPTTSEGMRFKSKRGVWDKIKGAAKSVANNLKNKVTGAVMGTNTKSAEDIEDCVACRFVWLQVEMLVGNSQIEENIYDAFTRTCIDAQKAPIFYPACEDMFDDVYGMIGDYMDGYTVNQICEGAKLCR